jgi:hypothetical protein
MRSSLATVFCTVCALVGMSNQAGAQNPPQSSFATINANKAVLPDLPNGQQPAGTKGVAVTGSFDCGYGKVAPLGQEDKCAKIEIYVFEVSRLNPRVMSLTIAGQDVVTPGAVRAASYNAKRFDLPVISAVTGQPAKYRVDVYLFINGQAAAAATTFIPEFTI